VPRGPLQDRLGFPPALDVRDEVPVRAGEHEARGEGLAATVSWTTSAPSQKYTSSPGRTRVIARSARSTTPAPSSGNVPGTVAA
jgi:hypothetical protein